MPNRKPSYRKALRALERILSDDFIQRQIPTGEDPTDQTLMAIKKPLAKLVDSDLASQNRQDRVLMALEDCIGGSMHPHSVEQAIFTIANSIRSKYGLPLLEQSKLSSERPVPKRPVPLEDSVFGI